jgi:hypothetical protein
MSSNSDRKHRPAKAIQSLTDALLEQSASKGYLIVSKRTVNAGPGGKSNRDIILPTALANTADIEEVNALCKLLNETYPQPGGATFAVVEIGSFTGVEEFRSIIVSQREAEASDVLAAKLSELPDEVIAALPEDQRAMVEAHRNSQPDAEGAETSEEDESAEAA